jgi:hypothetical protein
MNATIGSIGRDKRGKGENVQKATTMFASLEMMIVEVNGNNPLK